MNSILILGSGQIGSRHLQGVLKLNRDLYVFVLDPSNESLTLSKERAAEVEHNHLINYITNPSELPSEIDVVIIATDASIRYKVASDLIARIKIGFLILEKVLFQMVEEYDLFGQLIISKNLSTWVNHPRRMYPYYKKLKEEIKQTNLKKFEVVYVGNNWGIGCNAIHLIDLVSYLTDSKTINSIQSDFLDPEIAPTKRDKFIEFTGQLVVKFNDVSLNMTSHKYPESGNPVLFIATENDKWIIQEGKSISHVSSNENQIKSLFEFEDYFQSSLTKDFVEQLFTTGKCDLTTFEDSKKLHVPFISELLNFQNQQLKENGKILKIT